MGWSFRKSKSFGPFRLNVSKSGVGMSTGVKGARVSFGPRGTYVNLGRNGIYYRKKIGGGKTRQGYSNAARSKTAMASYEQSRFYDNDLVDAIRISDSITSSGLGREIVKSIYISWLVFCLWLVGMVVMTINFRTGGFIAALILAIPLIRLFSARVNYELDDEVALEWKNFIEALQDLRKSKKLWFAQTVRYNSNIKINAGAYASMLRNEAKVKAVKPNWLTGLTLKTDVPTVLIMGKQVKILFLPSGLLIMKGIRIFAFSYDDLALVTSTTKFVESGIVPKDAEIYMRTWQYVNKDGTPDRRYNNNRQLPVCLYGMLVIRGNGIDIEIDTSNNRIIRGIDNAYYHYRGYVKLLEKNKDKLQVQTKNDDYAVGNDNGLESIKDKTQILTKSNDYMIGANYVSPEEQKILEKLNALARDTGEKVLLDLLEKELFCGVKFIDGQVYQKHVILLYRADKCVHDQLDKVENKFNANLQYTSKMVPVSENEFLIHLYMDAYDRMEKELPLSSVLKDALEKAETWKPASKKVEASGIIETNNLDEVRRAGINLFSGELDGSNTHEEDPYSNLFEAEKRDAKNKDEKNDVVEDIMSFFEEE